MTGKIKYCTRFLIFLLIFYNNLIFAHCPSLKLTPSDINSYDKFGISVAVDGNFAVIGAPLNDSNGIDAGAAYIFEHIGSAWLQRQKLTALDSIAGAQFGWSVAIEANTIVVGSNLANNTGAVYIFTRSAGVWSQQAKLTAQDASSGDYFGCSVSLNGNTVVIGAHGDDSFTGSAYVFVRAGSTWSFEQKLIASDAIVGDRFGNSVAIDTNTALIGASDKSLTGANNAGSVYYFTRTAGTWSQQAILTASDPNSYDRFGCSVAIDSNLAVIGAYECGFNEEILHAGAAYVFSKTASGWVQQQKLWDTIDPGYGEDFGRSVAVDGSVILAGCPYNQVDGNMTGSVFEFVRAGQSWTLHNVLIADDSNDDDNFGFATAISGRNIIVGAHFNSSKGIYSGAAYAFNNIRADFDGDCDVDFDDFSLLAGAWRQNNPLLDVAPPPAGDGIVNIYDLDILCKDWLAGK
jgi:hypothetical protein